MKEKMPETIREEPRKRKKDKIKNRINNYGKYSKKHVRIQTEIIRKRISKITIKN